MGDPRHQSFDSAQSTPGEGIGIFEQLFECSPDAVLLVRENGLIARANAQAEKLFRCSRHQLVGQPIEMLVPERLRAAHAGYRAGYHAAPRPRAMGAGLDLYARRQDGSEFPADIMLSPLSGEEGSLVVAVVRDITERRQAQEALRLSEEQFRLLVEGVKDYALVMLDPGGRVVSWNSGAERIAGYGAEEILGQHFSRFYVAEDVERRKPEHGLEEAAREGRFEDEAWRVRKDGSCFWANVIITALRDEAGRLRGFAKVTRDFTERKRAEEALLLEITSVLVSNLDIRRLLAAIAASLRQIVAHDFASLALYDSGTGRLSLQALDPAFGKDQAASEPIAPLDPSPAGWAFTRGQPVIIDRFPDPRFPPASVQALVEQGVRSGCWMPLISRARVLGTLNVASRREAAFTQRDFNLLAQAANQIAIALDNAVAFRQIGELKD
ncbi:MAG TPA: PAS domain S-box protein, partial [Terriglobia bacterium]|nr:PAS domain S-box protein [Terriglobia bacterium]